MYVHLMYCLVFDSSGKLFPLVFDSLHKNEYAFLLGDFNLELSQDVEISAAMEEFEKYI